MTRSWGWVAMLLAGCGSGEANRYTGYVEGESVRVSSPVAGRLTVLAVARGATAQAGDALFTLEQEREQASVSEANGGIAAVRAQIEQANAQIKLADASYQRLSELRRRQGLASQEEVDQARTSLDAARARLRELEAQRQAAEAQLSQVKWQLTQKTVTAPAAGLVEDTIYRIGEWVPAGSPVVSLLPPANRLVRFFVPETVVGGLKAGQGVTLHCDGCAAPVAAKISFISAEAEFTPPVIYSRETRHKLVFLIEARPAPAEAETLHPGQPVEVELGP
jgi:HlyD family secretion protein